MDILSRAYNNLFYERADVRVKDWMLMKSPVPLFFIVSSYLLLIKVLLPAYMRNREPYSLKNIIKWYNAVQIVTNAVICWGIMTSGWTTSRLFGCWLPDYSTNPMELRMLRFLWWTVILKITELIETIFFVLRKKDRQASFLHIYHHVSVLVLMWCGVKYVGGGMATFPPMVICGVHVVMYTYYLLSTEGNPKLKAFLNKYKKWITIMQMVQFTVLLIHASQAFMPSCPAPLNIAYVYIPTTLVVYYLFYDFYKENYLKNRNTKGDVLNGKSKTKLHL